MSMQGEERESKWRFHYTKGEQVQGGPEHVSDSLFLIRLKSGPIQIVNT